MKSLVRMQLSAMMFLEYFIWGVWYVTMGIYLTKIGFHGKEIGAAYGTLAIGAIIAGVVLAIFLIFFKEGKDRMKIEKPLL